MKIHVHVGKIVLHALPVSPHGAPAIGLAVETELVRLLYIHGLASELQQEGRISGAPKSSFQLSTTNSPATLGIKIARSVFGALGESRRSKNTKAPEGRRGSPGAVFGAAGAKK